jgi:hypothetical protein
MKQRDVDNFTFTVFPTAKVENILKGSLHSIPSPSSSVTIKVMGQESLLEV